MLTFIYLVVCLAALNRAEFIEESLVYGKFPPNFIWAAATASYQVCNNWITILNVDINNLLKSRSKELGMLTV